MKKKFLKILTSFMAIVIMGTNLPLMAFAADNMWIDKASTSVERSIFQSVIVKGKIYAIGGNIQNQSISSVEEYNPQTDSWTTKAPMSDARTWFQAQVIGNKIYVMGGEFGENQTLNSTEVYDPETDKWTKLASMNVPRQSFSSVVINGKIYAIGGYNFSASKISDKILSSIEVYDPKANRWTLMSSMAERKRDCASAVANGKIYIFGGQNGYVEEYNPTTNKCTKKITIPISETNQAQVIDGKIYVLGEYTTDAIRYDPSTNTYEKISSMLVERKNYPTEVVDNNIYAIGGGSATVEKYDPKTNTWTLIASMKQEREFLRTEVIDNTIYAIGGNKFKSVEAYTVKNNDPTLTVKASSNKVMVNQKFTTEVAVHNGTNLCAEDIKVTYDPDLFEYNGVQAEDGMKIYKEDKSMPGTVRFIAACQGKDNAATGDKNLFHLIFTAKKPGTGKVDIIKGRIADNATLEEDVTDENCGEDTITVEEANDVNRSGEYTLLDLGIDAWYDGMKATDTDTTKYHADIVADGVINDKDLTQITQEILANSNYGPNK